MNIYQDTPGLRKRRAFYAPRPTLFIGTGGSAEFWRSFDNGAGWQQEGSAAASTQIPCFVQAADGSLSAGTVQAANAQFFRSTDLGDTWAATTTATGELEIHAMLRAANDYLVAGSGNNGKFWRSTDAGATWTNVQTAGGGITDINCFVLAANGDILAGTSVAAPAQVWRSQDNGATWAAVAGATMAGEASILSACRATNDDLFLGTGTGAEVWRSQNNGAAWVQVGTLTGETIVYALHRAPSGMLLAGTGANAEIWASVDLGVTWEQVYAVSGQTSVQAFATATNGSIVAVTGGAGTAEIWTSEFGLSRWRQIASGQIAGEASFTALLHARW